jgi:hypothetical protein
MAEDSPAFNIGASVMFVGYNEEGLSFKLNAGYYSFNDNFAIESNYTNSNKFLPTQRDLKGLEAQVHCSRLNLSTYIHVGKTLIVENGYSR